MVTRKEEKMPLPPSQPFHSSSARLAVACPSPTPSQPRGAASTGGLGTGPWPSGFAHIRRSRSRASASFPSPGTQGVAVKVSGPAGANTTLAAPCPRAPTQCALSRPGTGSAHHATWSPLTSCGHGSGRGSRIRRERRTRRAWGG